jgi:hypothetical protein
VATANLFYEAKAESGKTSLSDLIKNITMFENGPFKGSTTTKTYSFNGVWKDYVSQTYYYQDDFEDVNPPEGAIAFSACKPSVDMKLFPCFTANTRFYTIKFYNYNYNDVGEDALILTLTG